MAGKTQHVYMHPLHVNGKRAEEEPPVHDLKALVEASHAALEEKKGENDA